MEDSVEAIVMDNGSGLIKAGFAGEDAPRAEFSTAVGDVMDTEAFATHRANKKMKLAKNEKYIGSECQGIREFLSMRSPMERGSITDWDLMEEIWTYTFEKELGINAENANLPVLISDAPLGELSSREKMAQIMLETFKVPGFYVMQQCVLSLFASGRTRGIVVESGYGSTYSVPIFEGYALPHAILKLEVGGYDITNNLKRMLAKGIHAFNAQEEYIVEDIKEKHCFVSTSPNNPLEERSYELPDGTLIKVSGEFRSNASEILFNASYFGQNNPRALMPTLPSMVHHSISMCDKDLQHKLRSEIVLSGGTTMLPGFSQRLHTELCTLSPSTENRIVPDFKNRERGYNSQRRIATWIGGSMLASLSTFKNIQVTKQEWEESHEAIVHKKCY